MCTLSKDEAQYLHYIINQTRTHNLDNITRTMAYQNYYLKHTEIKWAFLASLVSRNAGWNMTDLSMNFYQHVLGKNERKDLFMTYERANWLIFSDIYPQLLVYELSKEKKQPMFSLLKHLPISNFIIKEWELFFKKGDAVRILTSLIINEQNVIEDPVIRNPYYHSNVFRKMPYLLQNIFYMSAVILPVRGSLYGKHVHNFTRLTNRITLGKQLASLVFHPELYSALRTFTIQVPHSGFRTDYEIKTKFKSKQHHSFNEIYPVISHQDTIRKDWYHGGDLPLNWFNPIEKMHPKEIGRSFYLKRNLLKYYDLATIRFRKK